MGVDQNRCAVDQSKARFFCEAPLRLRWRERGDDLVETRVAAQQIPLRVQTQLPIAQITGKFRGDTRHDSNPNAFSKDAKEPFESF